MPFTPKFKTSINLFKTVTNKCLKEGVKISLSNKIITPVSNSIKYFEIYRYDPVIRCSKLKTYTVNTNECGPMVLDALVKIKQEQDHTLSFKKPCEKGICGSCAMIIDGVNILACCCYINKSPKKVINVSPPPCIYTF